MEEPSPIGSLSGRVARGAGWIAAGRVLMGALGFASSIVVARLLTPADFGLVAVAVTAMQLLQGFSDFGAAQAVVRFRDADRRDLDTLFTLSALRGLLIAGLLVALAPLAADFYGDPRLVAAFCGAALYPLLLGLSNPRIYEFERALDFSKEFFWLTGAKLASVAAAIAIAIVYRSYWAIIAGMVAGAGVQLVLSYAMRPYRPGVSFASFRRLIGFTGWLAGVSFLAALNNKLDAMILARLVGRADTGHYYYGTQLAELPTRELASPVARAVYPGLSALQDEGARMRRAFLAGVEALGALALPASLGFAFVAGDAIALLLGGKWLGAVPVVEILTPVLGLQTLFIAVQFYAMAAGATRLIFMRELIFFLLRTPVFIWAAMTHGLEGAVAAAAGAGLLHVALNLAVYQRLARRPFWEPLWAARRVIAAAAAMSAYFLFLRDGLPAPEAAPARLVLDIAAGAGIYFAALIALWRLEGAPEGVERLALRFAAMRRAGR